MAEFTSYDLYEMNETVLIFFPYDSPFRGQIVAILRRPVLNG